MAARTRPARCRENASFVASRSRSESSAKSIPLLLLVRLQCTMVRPLPGHLALKDFNARKAVAGNLDPFLIFPKSTHSVFAANELLRRAYLYIVRNETIDSKIRGQAMLKLNAFPRAVSRFPRSHSPPLLTRPATYYRLDQPLSRIDAPKPGEEEESSPNSDSVA